MKSGRPLFVITFLISLSLQFSVNAQRDHLRFKRLTINDGLSLSSVYTIYQDAKGFMWFGTEDGLNKYDGKRFHIFRPDPRNTNSLSYKWTESIFEDSEGKLWLGSKGGLTKFDTEKERFSRYGSLIQDHQLVGDTITSLAEDGNKQLWVGTTSGINAIDINTGNVKFMGIEGSHIHTIKHFDEGIWIGTNHGLFFKSGEDQTFQKVNIDLSDTVDSQVFSLVQNTEEEIWVGIGNKLYKSGQNGKDVQWECVVNPSELRFQIDQIENLVVDALGTLWIACSNGLYKFDDQNKQIVQVIKSIDSSHSLAINAVKPLHLDDNGKLWYGTFGEGIYRVDINSGRHMNFRNNPGDIQSLSENSINSIFEDRSGNIWFGTFGAGINIYQPSAHKFGFISHQPLNTNSLSSNFVWSIMECDNGWLWIGTNDAGLNIYDPVLDRFQNYIHQSNDPTSISHSSVRKVYEDSKQRIWIGTDGGGLNQFFLESKKFVHYKNVPGDVSSISSNSVRVIYEDRDGRIWIGTRNGLNLFDPESGIFKRFLHDTGDESSLSNDFIYSSIYHDEHGNLWVGTYGGGLNRLEIAAGKFIHYSNDPSDPESLSDNIVFSIYESSDGNFWIGTNSGLNRFDPSTEKFERFGIREGLPNEVVYGILADERGNVWLSTNKGICRFDLEDHHTKNFSDNDGLQSNEFNGGAFHKGLSGRMYFGGVYGLNIIDPEIGYIDDNTSQMVITSLEIFGDEVLTNATMDDLGKGNQVMEIDDKYYMAQNISYADEIVLDYKHRFFSIEYAALNSTNTDNLRFQYMLEGLDDNWNDAGDRSFITFANMQPGVYTLNVRSTNVDGFTGLSAANLKITIIPPFWKTWWFYLIEIAVFVGLLVFIYMYLLKIRTNRLLQVQNVKIFQANQKLKESENDLKHLNATKDKFFSIISHDLKNPFTSLLSISELMSVDYKNLDESDKEQGIRRVHDSARRIYKLLENLLTWSRAQSGRLSYAPQNLDLTDIIKENVDLSHDFAKQKDIDIEVVQPEVIKTYCDREMINTVLRNLLNNAIKFSSFGKSIKVAVEDMTTSWKISVIDQGVGISDENQIKIFQIDAKFKTEGTSGEKGTGLGLMICKEFVEKNRGEISIKSQEGEGSTFSFTLPKSGSFVA